MLGFIKKDLLMIKNNIKIFLFLLFIYGVMTFQGEMNLLFLLPVMSVLMMISTFSYDTYNNWDAYLVSFPNGRKNSVKSKYLTTIMLIIITTILVTILEIIIVYAKGKIIDFESIISAILGGGIASVLMPSLMYPAIYKFGVEKARIGIFAFIFGISIIGGLLAKFVDVEILLESITFIADYWMIVLPIIIILMLYISYKISKRIYLKKEF